jgi:hypothetical protein
MEPIGQRSGSRSRHKARRALDAAHGSLTRHQRQTIASYKARRYLADVDAPICAACGSDASHVCSGCELFAYCGDECADHDWHSDHHTECELIGRRTFSSRHEGHRRSYSSRRFHGALRELQRAHPEMSRQQRLAIAFHKSAL